MKNMLRGVSVITMYVVAVLSISETVEGHEPELILQTGHKGVVDTVTFSPDGKLVASGSSDKTIKLWDVATGIQLRTLAGHSEGVSSLAFSPNGKFLASGSSDRSIKLWNVTDGTQVRSLAGHSDSVFSVAFSPDGRLLASAGNDRTIRLWEVTTGSQVRSLIGHSQRVTSIAFSRSGKLLVSGSLDNTIKVWNVAKGTSFRSFAARSAWINSVAFDPDGTRVASAPVLTDSSESLVNLWDVFSGAKLATLRHSHEVASVMFSSEGKLLASASWDCSIKLWDVASRTLVGSLAGHANPVLTIAFSPNGKLLASGDNNATVKLWEVTSRTQLLSFTGYSNPVTSVAFSPNGNVLVSGSSDAKIKPWDAMSGTQLPWISDDADAVNSVTFSPDGKLLASASLQWRPNESEETIRTIKLWDVATRALHGSLEGPFVVYSVAFSPDGRLLASGGVDGLRLWDVAGHSRDFRLLDLLSDGVMSVAFSRDGKLLASGGQHPTIRMWNVKSGTQVRSFIGHSAPVESVAFSPNGKLLASGSSDKTIKLWKLASGTHIRSFMDHSAAVNTVVFSPDGKLLASGSADATIRLWDVTKNRQPQVLSGHFAGVRSVTFSPDGKLLLSGGDDETIKLWNVEDGHLLATLISLDQNDWLVVTPDKLFDGSPTAWRKIAWRFNNNTFEFAPVEAFFADFYYPGLLTDILSGKRPKAPARIDEKDLRQPQVNVLRAGSETLALPEVTTSTVKIQVEVIEASADPQKNLPSGGAQGLRVFRNGSLIKVWRSDAFALGLEDGCHQPSPGKVACIVDVPVIAGDNHFTAYAFNRDNVKSNDSQLLPEGAESLKRGSTLYILAIGIDKYANPAYDLKFAVADARDFAHELKTQQQKLKIHTHTEIIAISDNDATKANILFALRRLVTSLPLELPGGTPTYFRRIRPSHPEDAIVIYFAGHGTAHKDRFYLIPHDLGVTNEISALDENSLKTLLERSISDVELESALEGIDAAQLLMVIDACNSGQALEAEEKRRGPMNSKGLAQLAYEKGMYILTASQSHQAALEVSRLGHGLLTYALLEGLADLKADKDHNRQVWEREWLDYASERVPQVQVEEMKQRGAEAVLVFVAGEEHIADPTKRNVQRPRVFYRRDVVPRPFVIAGP